MTYTAEQLIATNQANVDALEGLTTHTFAGLEKLVELNLAASKAALAESFNYARASLGAKDAQQLLALQTGLFQPLAEKSVSYGNHVYSVAAETGAVFTKAFEAKVDEAKKAFAVAVENMTKNAPAGTESAVAAFKSAVNVSQNAIETAQGTAKKAVELAEANFTAVTKQAVSAASAPSRKR